MIAPATPKNESERLASLRSLGLVDTPPEERFDSVTRLATTIFQLPISYSSLVEESTQFLKSRVGLDFCESSRETSFCGHAILEIEPLIIPDTLKDERFRTTRRSQAHLLPASMPASPCGGRADTISGRFV